MKVQKTSAINSIYKTFSEFKIGDLLHIIEVPHLYIKTGDDAILDTNTNKINTKIRTDPVFYLSPSKFEISN